MRLYDCRDNGVVKFFKKSSYKKMISWWLAFLCFFCFFTGIAAAERSRIAGVTESVRDITMSVPDQGIVREIFFAVGDRVAKGQAILELDNSREKLEMERRKLVWEDKAEVDGAAKRVETISRIFEASRKLYESTKSVSREELDKQELEYDNAVSELNQLKIAEDREKIEYDIALESYQRRILKSPIDGVIVKLDRDVGEYVEPGQVFLQIVDTKSCYMVCQLDEKRGRKMKKGKKADIEVMAGEKWLPIKAVVSFVSPVVDQASGLLKVKLKFDNKKGKIRPGVPGVLLD